MQMSLGSHSSAAPQRLFDWQLDVQRLEREAKAAAAASRADPWTKVEAECSLDLIEAELVALSKRDPRQVSDSVIELRSWKARVERVIRMLDALEEADER